ncbi:MAG: hypothetical protein ACE5IT_02185 [bacterium]
MNIKIYRDFLEQLGYKIVQTESGYWYNHGKFIYFNLPFFKPVNPSKMEIKKLFLNPTCWGVRFSTTGNLNGKESFMWVCRDKSYGLKNLKSKARNQTRRGLENCEVEKITLERLHRYSGEIDADTLKRQGRKINTEYWKHHHKIASRFPGFEAFGALVNKKLVAYTITFQMDDCCNILMLRSLRDYLKYYPNNSLLYSVIKMMLSRPEVSMVFFGAESLKRDMESLRHFKESMGFVKEYIKQRGIIHPLISSFVKRFSANSKIFEPFDKYLKGKDKWEKFLGFVQICK